ncbi:MAG: PHP domain-containing protein [Candidatus Lokiarchaeota archaeon]|nr:PHP domain-containing protein [Candidatus Lokiarchaeota archaeon]
MPDDPNWSFSSSSPISKKDFAKKFINKAKENEFELIAITDHFNYQDYKDSYMAYIYNSVKKEILKIILG